MKNLFRLITEFVGINYKKLKKIINICLYENLIKSYQFPF